MKKLSYLISSGGRFHNFEVAKVLYSRNQLHKIIKNTNDLKSSKRNFKYFKNIFLN